MLTEQGIEYSHQYAQGASLSKSFQWPNTINEMATMECASETDYDSSQHGYCGDIAFDDERSNSYVNDEDIEDHNFGESNADVDDEFLY